MADYTHNDSIIVKNISGTSAERYRIDRLYDKYLESGGTDSPTCQRKGCKSPATATAHVRKTDGRRDDLWWLTRLCASCNSWANDDEMALRKNAKLILVRDITGT